MLVIDERRGRRCGLRGVKRAPDSRDTTLYLENEEVDKGFGYM